MGLVTSALTSGRNALLAYQNALQVVGNNVANAGNPNYARQSAHLAAVTGVRIGSGLEPGAGVTISALERHMDESLENRLRIAIGDVESAAARRDALTRVETFFNDLSGGGVSARLTDFFNAMSDVQNAPDDVAIRGVAISAAGALADSLRQVRRDLIGLAEDLNADIEELTGQGNRLAAEIAELNGEITRVEASGTGQANALRDRRDALLRQLSEILDVAVREQPDGSVNVYVGNEPLIQRGASRGLTVVEEADGDFVRSSVRFADTNSQVNVAGGRIEGLVTARDEQVLTEVEKIDRLAAALVAEINAVHSEGQGLQAFTSVTGTEPVDDTTAALDSAEAGLSKPPVNGSFFITVTDEATGTPVAHRIELDLDGTDAGTSLDDLAAAINAQVNGVTASITTDNRLTLSAAAGFGFTFGHDGEQVRADTSKVLAALGINTFFDGSSAADIAVREYLVTEPGALAAATVNRVGDGNNAGRIAGLINEGSDYLDGTSVLDFYNSIANGVAGNGAVAKDATEAAEAVAQALQIQREGISGVSLDEEAIDLLKFERAFQGAARYVSTVDRMMQEMLALVR